MSERIPIIVRSAGPDDTPYIVSTFVKSQRNQGDNRGVPNKFYFPVASEEAMGIVDRCDVWVAYIAEEPSVILGWIALDEALETIAFAYTRHSFRRMGVFDALYSHLKSYANPQFVRHLGWGFQHLSNRYGLTDECERNGKVA